MNRRLAQVLRLLAMAGGLAWQSASGIAAQEPRDGTRLTVHAADVGKTVALVGRLGKPMTAVVDLKGHWEDRGFAKASRFAFVVTAVDGRPVEPPVEFNRYVVSIDGKEMTDQEVILNETWSCKAIELGRFRNVLEKNWELFYDSPVSPPRWGDGPFVSELILCKRTLVRKPVPR